MGQNLARNIASRGNRVSVFNRTYLKTQKFIERFGMDDFSGFENIKDFVSSLERPRKIMLMVKAGDPVDSTIEQLLPYLEKGDIVIDGGNSFFKDTIRREKYLSEKGVHFVGSGVSGGEEGALHGPSIMPGGSEEAWKELKSIFESIAAKDFSGGPCVTHIGTDGSGHFVKMVHNGIEYGIMQLIAETYDIFRKAYSLSAGEIADIFEEYNKGRLESFLMEISVPVLRKTDEETGKSLIDIILDTAGQKGTGRWTNIESLDLGVAAPTIAAATIARVVSSYKEERIHLADQYKRSQIEENFHPQLDVKDAKQILESALYAAILTCYAEGFELIKAGAKEYQWNINYKEISRIWEGGCIIRSRALNLLREAFASHTDIPPHLFSINSFKKIFQNIEADWRTASSFSIEKGIATPAFHAGLDYYLGMTETLNPANLIQGLRDFFGAHTYKRTDKDGVFHTDWT